MRKVPAAAAAFAVALSMLFVPAVMGHAALQSSDPADGATIKTPYTLTATYDDDLTPNGSSIVVQSAGGTQVASGPVSGSDPKTMTIDLPVLPDGEYTVLWVAVTADDNGVTRGTYHFTTSTTGPSGTATPATPAPSAAPGAASGSGNDLLIPIGILVIAVVAVAAYFIYRNRR